MALVEGSAVLVQSGSMSGMRGVVVRVEGDEVVVEIDLFGRATSVTLPSDTVVATDDPLGVWRDRLDRRIAHRERSELFAWWAERLDPAPPDDALLAIDAACHAWRDAGASEREARRVELRRRLDERLSAAEDVAAAWQSFERDEAAALDPVPLDEEQRDAVMKLMARVASAPRTEELSGYDAEREHIEATLSVSVRSGYRTLEEIREDLREQVRDEFRREHASQIQREESRFLTKLERAWDVQRAAEATWPDRTYNDRIDDAFAALEARGIVALQDAGYTMSEGWEDVHAARDGVEGAWGAVFFHRQDVERAVENEGLMLAFGAFASGDDHEAESLRLAHEVCDVLEAHDVATEWNGSLDKRIAIPPFTWQRRRRD